MPVLQPVAYIYIYITILIGVWFSGLCARFGSSTFDCPIANKKTRVKMPRPPELHQDISIR